MSFHELKEQVERLTPAERAELSLHLNHLAAIDDPATIAEIARRLDEMEGGSAIIDDLALQARISEKR